jgi:hypothetical protein
MQANSKLPFVSDTLTGERRKELGSAFGRARMAKCYDVR